MSAGQANSVRYLSEFLPVFSPTSHEEEEVYNVEDEADRTEGDPEEGAEEDAEEEGDSPEGVSTHDAAPEEGLVDVVGDEALAGHKHPFLLSGVEVDLHPPHHVDQSATCDVFGQPEVDGCWGQDEGETEDFYFGGCEEAG